MERLLRRRKCLRSQLHGILKEAEGILREQQEPATSQCLTARVAGTATSKHYRILFDGGSQRSFITIDASRTLGCQFLEEETVNVGVFGGRKTQKTMRRVRVIVFPEKTDNPIEIEALEVADICIEHIPIPDEEVIKKKEETGLDTRSLSLGGDSGNSVDILIGSDYYWQLVTGDVKTAWKKWKNLKSVRTKLGWTVQGPLPFLGSIVHCSSVIILRTCVEEDTVSEVLSRFWDLESLGVRADEESLLDSELTLQEFEKNITIRTVVIKFDFLGRKQGTWQTISLWPLNVFEI
ncbi:hypothetical protein HPB49_008424 [Dermacentor silvarum]|uniref:Uncharacterized protein n=1 Tax=Dermacentor silvarum TaxID=543639 RepID=A0ACB8C8I5_DERSI|nr:hypothetical protein HPB49_008424 [Dermacentor silvarum]